MIVPINKKAGNSPEKRTLPALCDAHIPLLFIKRISSGTVKRLALYANIFTLEELHLAQEDTIREQVPNRKMLEEIFSLREQTKLMMKMAKHRNILLFEKRAQGSNIKITPDQRAQLIGIAIFANLCKDITEVISYALNIETEIFRQKALIKKLVSISNQAVRRA